MPNGAEHDRNVQIRSPRHPVRSSCQSSNAELGQSVEFPNEVTPEELAMAVVQPVDIKWWNRPE